MTSRASVGITKGKDGKAPTLVRAPESPREHNRQPATRSQPLETSPGASPRGQRAQRGPDHALSSVGKAPEANRVYPRNLRSLLLQAQKMLAEGSGQEEIVEFVYEVAGQFGIRIRHDQHDPHFGPAPPSLASEGTADQSATPAPRPGDGGPCGKAPAPPKAAAGNGGARDAPERARLRASRRKEFPIVVSRRPDGTHVMSLSTGPGPRSIDPDALEDQAAPVQGATVGRLILSGDRRGGGDARGSKTPLYYECNGLVLDARTWHALAVPPCAFNLRPLAKVVDSALADDAYDIIGADDGTVVTLYHWIHPADGGVWALASSNGYDVSSLHWIGPLTYAEVFYDLVSKYYPAFADEAGIGLTRSSEGQTRLTFANLARDRSYTIGFRHHNFHPMLADPERMWQIQHAVLTGASPRVVQHGGLPGIPDQKVSTSELKARVGTTLTLATLRNLGSNAFEEAVRLIGTSRDTGSPLRAGELNYGYILRSRSPERTRDSSDLLVESPLLARIRKLAYERAPRLIRDKLTADERLEHNALRAYLTANERLAFLALFPNWAPKFQAYEEFTSNVVHLVVHAMRQRTMAPASREPAMRSTTGQVARALLDHISRYESPPPFNRDTDSIVRDYVVSPEYAYLFLRALRSTLAPASSSPAPVTAVALAPVAASPGGAKAGGELAASSNEAPKA